MTALLRSLRQIPFWAYILVILVIFVNSVYLRHREQVPADGLVYEQQNGKWIVIDGDPAGAGFRAGIRPGDTVLSVNSRPFESWLDGYQDLKAGDAGVFRIGRDHREIVIRLILDPAYQPVIAFFRTIFVFLVLCSISGLFLLVKKRDEKTAVLFFIYMQLVCLTFLGGYIHLPEPIMTMANVVFVAGIFLTGAVLIHFYLLFPERSLILKKAGQIPRFLYGTGVLFSVIVSGIYIRSVYQPSPGADWAMSIANIATNLWLTCAVFMALIVAIIQYLTITNTLVRNQIRILIAGTLFLLIPLLMLTFLRTWVINNTIPFELLLGLFSFFLITCMLIALFRYRIWDLEIIIRKAMLYFGATGLILLSYLLLLWLADQFLTGNNRFTRFAILAVSVLLFLVLRDRLQRLVDRLFHRETYDPATVVAEFEMKLAGVYRLGELKEKIVLSLDEIFHFTFFVFCLKKDHLVYEAACGIGIPDASFPADHTINAEMEEKLKRSKVFSPDELMEKTPFLERTGGDLIVPMMSGNQPAGFFLCGGKKSERIYSRQDITVLALLARRVTAMLQTAALYRNDLDRQLMLERERARIAHDMHDDIGAGLTRIAMISEAPVGIQGPGDGMQERLDRVASACREMIARLNVIVWALNPKYDNLESLVSYLRRYFGEYLENSGMQFQAVFPELVPAISITPDTRRNIFYAVQEAIHNAVKHSGGSAIMLTIRIDRQNMEIAITDDGKGFDQVRPGSGGNGLLSMKKRAEELGGTCEIRSLPGDGTTIIFTVSL